MKRSNDHTKAAMLFVIGALVLGGIIFVAIKSATSIPSEQPDASEAVTNTPMADTAAPKTEVKSDDIEEESDNKNVLPNDEDKIAMLAGSAFSDMVSAGSQYCGGKQIVFDYIGTDGVRSLTMTNPPDQPGLAANWNVKHGKLILTNIVPLDSDGNEIPAELGNSLVQTLKVWANGQGEANSTKMTESGQIQVGNSPILAFCRIS